MSGRGNWQGRALGPGQYTRAMLAEKAQVSDRTIKRWQQEGFLLPTNKKGNMWLFNDTTVAIAIRLKELEHHNLDTRFDIITREFGDLA